MPATRQSDILVIHHQGHNSPCDVPLGDPDFDGTVDWLNQLGYDVMNLHMPLYQVGVVLSAIFIVAHSVHRHALARRLSETNGLSSAVQRGPWGPM